MEYPLGISYQMVEQDLVLLVFGMDSIGNRLERKRSYP